MARSKHRFKGPVFPSFKEPPRASIRPLDAPKKQRYNFVTGHQSTRQIKRGMKQRLRSIIDSKDRDTILAGDRVIYAVREEPDPEYSALHLFGAAQRASNDTGEPWHVCMNYLMDEFDRREAGETETTNAAKSETPASRNPGGWFGGRLLRSILSRTLRKSNEAVAEGDVDQSAGTSPAQSS